MWTRGELKSKAKDALRFNYWKVVLIGLLMSVLAGGLGAGSGAGSYTSTIQKKLFENEKGKLTTNSSKVRHFWQDYDISYNVKKVSDNIDGKTVAVVAAIVCIVLVIALIVLVISLLFSIFLFNPLEIGAKRFFNRSFVEKAKVKEVAYAFDHSYKNTIKIMFFRGLYTFLWSLLLIVPGIIKHYEYYMVAYILGENPDMDMTDVFAKSKEMMYGNKWKAFVLDLSFIGWAILSGITLGIVGIFFASPYYFLTQAALYRKLNGSDDIDRCVNNTETYGYISESQTETQQDIQQ